MVYTSTALAWLALAAGSTAQFGIKHTQYGTSPPVYPSPNVTGAGGWEAALAKAKSFIAQLSLEEKAGMVTGKNYTIPICSFADPSRHTGALCWVNIPSLCFVAHRKLTLIQKHCTYSPP